MLDLDSVDLRSLAEALEDHSDESTWWLDPATGAVEAGFSPDDTEHDDENLSEGWVEIDHLPSQDSYGDLEDFTARVRDRRAHDLLERAIAGRGAFRRFKDTLFEFPELREAWFRFHDLRMERRAIEWLAREGLIDPRVAERSTADRPDPDLPELSGPFDAYRIAENVARDLGEMYGARLRKVILFGSWARGDAHPESDIDLLVVLDRVDSSWDELRRMEPILDEHSVANGTIVTAISVDENDFEDPTWPAVISAKREGRAVA